MSQRTKQSNVIERRESSALVSPMRTGMWIDYQQTIAYVPMHSAGRQQRVDRPQTRSDASSHRGRRAK
jgi:hypothetical protein